MTIREKIIFKTLENLTLAIHRSQTDLERNEHEFEACGGESHCALCEADAVIEAVNAEQITEAQRKG